MRGTKLGKYEQWGGPCCLAGATSGACPATIIRAPFLPPIVSTKKAAQRPLFLFNLLLDSRRKMVATTGACASNYGQWGGSMGNGAAVMSNGAA
jgi:hypothetical protein